MHDIARSTDAKKTDAALDLGRKTTSKGTAKPFTAKALAVDRRINTSALARTARILRKYGRGWTISRRISAASMAMRIEKFCWLSIAPIPTGAFGGDLHSANEW
jgi:hypothetical protein